MTKWWHWRCGAADRGIPTVRAHGWASLTQAERDIVGLVAEGMTNKEVGDRLFISDRTVRGHLAQVFRKLDMKSRRELREARRQLLE